MIEIISRMERGDISVVQTKRYMQDYNLMGEVHEKAVTGAVKNKGSYLVTLIKIEASKRGLPWATKENKL